MPPDPVPVLTLRPTACPLCDPGTPSREVYPQRLNTSSFSAATFSARRRPDRIHYRMVRCSACGLVRSDPIADPTLLAQLYRSSTFDYDAEVPNLRDNYLRVLDRAISLGAERTSLLEIGCGNGFFLGAARTRGFEAVHGIEPSEDAVSKAEPNIRPFIVADISHRELFPDQSFDVICVFQLLDHIESPVEFVSTCLRWLRPGGFLCFVNHDVESLSMHLLGEASPIVDVEHTHLYSRRTQSLLLKKCGLEVIEAVRVWDRCSLRHLVHLTPLPLGLKRVVQSAVSKVQWVAQATLPVPLGNIRVIARRHFRK